MCGIMAAASCRDVTPILLEGLRRLEYRGYDSCGIALIGPGQELERARTVRRVADLTRQVQEEGLAGRTGIAHTRWATHGAPEVRNAHPIVSNGMIAVVHNGIIENYSELKRELESRGYQFASQTDTEVIAHLIHFYYEGDLLSAVSRAVSRLRGSFGIAVCCTKEPHVVVGARRGSPLVMGLGEKENFLASDVMALSGVTERFVFLEEGDIARITPESAEIFRAAGDGKPEPVSRRIKVVTAHDNNVALGPYRHYMQKEIFEQPRAIADTLEGVAGIVPSIFGPEAEGVFRRIRRILILACGTSYYAGLTAKYWIEAIAGIPCEVEIASEYRYRISIPHEDSLVVCVSQSGETSDTLSALAHAQSLGMKHTLAICNVATSALVHNCELHYITRAGVEIGVASTKAFTTQLAALYLLTLVLAKLHGRLSLAEEEQRMKALRHIPSALQAVLALEPQIMATADIFATKQDALFLGRGMHYPIALEGALKLKEISYIHAEAYPAGELKHGPLALVDSSMPVVVVAPNDSLLEKLKGNMAEVSARGGELYVFADGDSAIVGGEKVHVLRLPEHYGDLSPILHVVALQLLAYHTALIRGTDVDKPRNLAKSVTVE
ncbi:glutamine--fructose-6-phosphate transaminase (isomerizing) [Mesosutterella sp. OilRF-GAM-744-9]|uniref:Glutamine--fructose-6-phosphate aminotransferase [isomerizing] n=1 Tax=Mesosutterella porci TaxID=2915351 RepID=A0ABS9MNH8_9BURK|nr:glutamine--fructose-6-phosphate transaminase (isomerizing) [Mesosutterella sp. oilRF-744-WT-GAM-9]MCG5030176.1 glutamine--fructose-6-phosphate transaminase (isomerizing) [Mesosutterella sp. oilRF-744-WT-GAM-9]MCI6531238.1 glutamine--fructose-6-phosphate transaminase (isomerizing) [Mesosutterella sp.]